MDYISRYKVFDRVYVKSKGKYFTIMGICFRPGFKPSYLIDTHNGVYGEFISIDDIFEFEELIRSPIGVSGSSI